MSGAIAFQGLPGAYSDLACRTAFPDLPTLPCESFETAIEAVREGRAELGMMPCENTLAGRVTDMHHLLPESGLFVVGEHFHRVEHCLLARPGTRMEQLRRAHSHAVALGQVRHFLRRMNLTPVVAADTAGAARMVAEQGGPEDAAIASSLAAEIYGLEILAANVEDAAHNTTRFYVMARRPRMFDPATPNLMTTFVFRVRNVPAALYKALGGFATNGVNMTKLESYMLGGQFVATQFLCDCEGHPEQPALRRALRSRDRGCRFPGCTHVKHLHAHHIEHWARGGRTDLDNLVQLCSHHHQLVHEGGYRVARGRGSGLEFRTPDGRLISQRCEMRPASGLAIAAQHRVRRLGIGSDTCRPLSAGDPLDYDIAVEGLIRRELRRRE